MENAIYTPEGYTDRIRQELGNCLIETNLSQGEKFIGKVRIDTISGIVWSSSPPTDRVPSTGCWPLSPSKGRSST